MRGWVNMGYEYIYLAGALILLVGLAYAVFRDRTRDKSKDAITEAATKEQYEHRERYQRTQKAFEEAAKDE